jgi:hypothetical protein
MPLSGLQSLRSRRNRKPPLPSFEHLEAEGQRLLLEELKMMLKALTRSNLLRGGSR